MQQPADRPIRRSRLRRDEFCDARNSVLSYLSSDECYLATLGDRLLLRCLERAGKCYLMPDGKFYRKGLLIVLEIRDPEHDMEGNSAS
ncbi:hypothetical protein BS78_09G249400 [Paspalum vaginatum]|nr:hypothetical protein BS78_09G249400 [Paspalum vaginatum]